MKRIPILLCLLHLLLVSTSKAQFSMPTNREVFNFSVGDTFVYDCFQYDGSCPVQYAYACSHEYVTVVTGKTFSLDSNTVYYTYHYSGYSNNPPFGPAPQYTNLDSPVILPPYPDYTTNEIDTSYIDTSHYCVPKMIAYRKNRYGLSDFLNTTYASGLGKTEESYWHDQGSPPDGDFAFDLVYYHKGNIICGTYDSAKLVSSIADVSLGEMTVLYPDPATDKLSINTALPDPALTITDVTGRICALSHTDHEVDVSSLPVGIYIIWLQSRAGSLVRRFVKE